MIRPELKSDLWGRDQGTISSLQVQVFALVAKHKQ